MTAPGPSVPQSLRPGDPVAIILMNEPANAPYIHIYVSHEAQETLRTMLNEVRTVVSAQAPSTVP